MKLEDADIEEFIALWKEEFGESISLDEARHRASQVMELYALLATSSWQGQSHQANRRHDSP
jgi:hypothetical protein